MAALEHLLINYLRNVGGEGRNGGGEQSMFYLEVGREGAVVLGNQNNDFSKIKDSQIVKYAHKACHTAFNF